MNFHHKRPPRNLCQNSKDLETLAHFHMKFWTGEYLNIILISISLRYLSFAEAFEIIIKVGLRKRTLSLTFKIITSMPRLREVTWTTSILIHVQLSFRCIFFPIIFIHLTFVVRYWNLVAQRPVVIHQDHAMRLHLLSPT